MNRRKSFLLILLVLLLSVTTVGVIHYRNRTIVIEMSIYSGNSWGIPQAFVYAIYDLAEEMFLSNPDNARITIRYKTGALYKHYSERLAQLILKGKEPDLFLLVEEDFNTYSSIGVLQNLDPLIANDSDFPLHSFYPRALEAGMVNGCQYSLPISLVPSFMIVNKTLLSEYGIEIDRDNWNWDRFYEICRKLTKDRDGDGDLDTFGVYGYDWHHAFYSNDRYLFNPDSPVIGFKNRNMVETLQFLKKMHKLNRGENIREKDFENGNAGFKIFNLSEYKVYGTYPYRILKYENFEWEALPLPAGPMGKSSSKLYTVQLGMSSRSRHKKEAFRFMKFLSSDPYFQQEIWNRTNTLPANKNVVNAIYSSRYEDLNEMKILSFPLLNHIIENSYIDPDFKWYSSMDEMIGQKISLITYQDMDVEKGVKELRADIEESLRRYR